MQIPGAWVDLVGEVANEVLREIGTRYWLSTLNKSFWRKLTIFRLLHWVKIGKLLKNLWILLIFGVLCFWVLLNADFWIFSQLDTAGSFTTNAIHQRNGRGDVNPGAVFLNVFSQYEACKNLSWQGRQLRWEAGRESHAWKMSRGMSGTRMHASGRSTFPSSWSMTFWSLLRWESTPMVWTVTCDCKSLTRRFWWSCLCAKTSLCKFSSTASVKASLLPSRGACRRRLDLVF